MLIATGENFRSANIASSQKCGRQRRERMFTTTSRDADMAGDRPGVWRESTPAGAARLPDKGSKQVNSRRAHKHNNRDNESSIPNRADTSSEAAGRRAPPDRRR